MCFAFNISAGHVPRALLTIMRTSKCLLWSLSSSLLQNRTRKLSTVTKPMRKIIFPIEMIRKRLLLILIIYTTLCNALTTWCRKIPEFQRASCLQTRLLSNIVTCISVRFDFTFYVSVCLSVSLSFSSICLNMLSILFQKQEMQKRCRDLKKLRNNNIL